jgi:hypothetical protein
MLAHAAKSRFGVDVRRFIPLQIVLVLVATAIVAATVALVWPRADHVSYRNSGRIPVGMGRQEVYPILGPPGNYTTGPMTPWFGEADEGTVPPNCVVDECWKGNIGIVDLFFTPQGTVAAKRYRWHGPENSDFTSFLRRFVDDIQT